MIIDRCLQIQKILFSVRISTLIFTQHLSVATATASRTLTRLNLYRFDGQFN